MKRRHFLLQSAGASLLGALPLGAVAALRGNLLDDAQAWIGESFQLPDGGRVQLTRVESLPGDRRTTQLRLQFRSIAGTVPPEGTHALEGRGILQDLFLQAGREGPVACVNRLNRHA